MNIGDQYSRRASSCGLRCACCGLRRGSSGGGSRRLRRCYCRLIRCDIADQRITVEGSRGVSLERPNKTLHQVFLEGRILPGRVEVTKRCVEGSTGSRRALGNRLRAGI